MWIIGTRNNLYFVERNNGMVIFQKNSVNMKLELCYAHFLDQWVVANMPFCLSIKTNLLNVKYKSYKKVIFKTASTITNKLMFDKIVTICRLFYLIVHGKYL